ncbi:MAG: hypothetical protein MSS94_08900, partial [Clostridiales bacterium]|nr:hypothetical protein [Clostridiales bacterium]
SVSILFVGDGFPVPLHSGLFTASPNPFGRFSRLLREAKRLPYAPTNSQFSAPLCSPDRSIALARRHFSPYPGPESLLPFCFPWAIMILNQKTTKEKLLWTFGTLPTSAT